jgi:hypothetical protein
MPSSTFRYLSVVIVFCFTLSVEALSSVWRWQRSSEYAVAVHRGHPAAFVTQLGSKIRTGQVLQEVSNRSDRTAENSNLYAKVTFQQFEALKSSESLLENAPKNSTRVAFTALEDVFGSEYVGPIGVGTRRAPAYCKGKSLSELQVMIANNDNSCDENAEVANLKVVFDTGSTNLWMASDLCQSPCRDEGRHWYDHTDSHTYTQPPSEKYLRIMFGTAALAGPMGVDNFKIGPFTLKDQDFGMIEEASGSTFLQMPLEGIVGLAFPAMSATKDGRLPFFDNVIKQGLLEHNEFAFYFSKDVEKSGNAIFWGGVDARAFEEEIRMFPVSQPFYWAVDLYAFHIGDEALNLEGGLQERVRTRVRKQAKYSPVPASTMPKLILDTGTTYFTAGGTLYDQIRERLPSGNCQDTAKYPSITYTLKDVSGRMYNLSIPSTEYMVSHTGSYCRLAFMELYVNEHYGPAMLLGEVFMRSYFTVYDRGNGDPSNARVGFGKSKDSSELTSMFSPGNSGVLAEAESGANFGAPK